MLDKETTMTTEVITTRAKRVPFRGKLDYIERMIR